MAPTFLQEDPGQWINNKNRADDLGHQLNGSKEHERLETILH